MRLRVLFAGLAGLLVLVGCAAPRLAAQLATVTSGHVNTLNLELKQYANAATAARQQDAKRIAAAQSRWNQEIAYNQRFLTEWQIDRRAALSQAFGALQKQSDSEMSTTDSYLKQQADETAQLTAAFGSVTYDPSQLQAVIAALQSLTNQAGTQQQLSAIRDFASTTLSDVKQELNAAQPKAQGE